MRSGEVPRATATQEAPSALDAKLIGNKVLPSENFINSQYDIMKEIVEAKASQCREFHDVLKNAPPKAIFVVSTYNNFWGSRQNIAGTKHTNKTAWRHYYKTFPKKMKKINKNAWLTSRASDAKKLRQCRKNRTPQEDDGISSESE